MDVQASSGRPTLAEKLVKHKCPSRKLRDLRRSFTFIQQKIKSEYAVLRKENEDQRTKINNLEVRLKEKEEIVQLNDRKITSMEFESKTLKQKLIQYSIFLKNAVAENDKLKTTPTGSNLLSKLNDENTELAKKLKSSKESIREKNREIARLKIDQIDLRKASSAAQNKVSELHIDKT